jgi:hypothetical protein
MAESSRQRSLWPREHGAYAQLAAPLLTALVIVRPTVAAGLLAIAACCAFLANEPLLVILGHRGKRLREQAGARATRALVILTAIAAVTGSVGLALAPRAIVVAAIVAVPAAITIALAWRRLERTLVGEAVAAVALSGAAAPVVVAAGGSQRAAILIWAAWAIGYACTVFAVHRVIARHRARASWQDSVLAVVFTAVTTAVIALLARGSVVGAATPLALASLVLVVRPPRATYLRTIGVVLVVASVAAGALTWVTL